VPDPFGVFTAAGETLFSWDLKRVLAKLPRDAKCFFPDRPVLVVSDKDVVTAVSLNSLQPGPSVRLPLEFTGLAGGDWRWPRGLPDRGSGRTFSYRMRFFPDAARNRVVIAYGPRAAVLPLKALKAPSEPILRVRTEMPAVFPVGRTTRVTLVPLAEECRLALHEPPKGMKLVGTTLTWTPNQEQAGKVKITLNVSHGTSTATQTWPVRVGQPFVPVGFEPGNFAVSPSGMRALAWYTRNADQAGDDEPRTGLTRLAVCDMTEGRVLAGKCLLYEIHDAAIGEKYVYVAPVGSPAVHVLNASDLARRTSVKTPSAIRELWLVSPRTLMGRFRETLVTISTKTLALSACPITRVVKYPQQDPRTRRYSNRRRPAPRPPRWWGRGWCVSGYMLDADLTRTQALLAASDLPAMNVRRVTRREVGFMTAHNRLVQGGLLTTDDSKPICRLFDDDRDAPAEHMRPGALVMRAHPVAAAVTGEMKDLDSPTDVTLVLRDLIEGKVVKKLTLLRLGKSTPEGWSRRSARARLLEAGGRVFVLAGNCVVAVSIDKPTLDACRKPMTFQPPRMPEPVDLAKTVTLTHKLIGGKGPMEFDLTTRCDGVEIDFETGAVKLTGATLRKAALVQLAGGLAGKVRGSSYSRDRKPLSPEQVLREFADKARQQYTRLTGRKIDAIPVLLPVGVVAMDQDQQIASVEYQVTLALAEKDLAAALAANLKEYLTEQQRRLERARPGPTTAKSDPRRAELDKRVKALQDRLEELRKRVERMDAAGKPDSK